MCTEYSKVQEGQTVPPITDTPPLLLCDSSAPPWGCAGPRTNHTVGWGKPSRSPSLRSPGPSSMLAPS